MKPKSQPAFAFVLAIAAFAGFALPVWGGSIVLAPANISTSLDQCESQDCGTFPPLASYSGTLSSFSSSFSGTQTVGEGAFITASGFSSPTLTSQVPAGNGANAIINAELTYLLEVVPVDGDTTSAPVLLGVSAAGSNSVATTGGPEDSNGANSLLQLALLSDLSGDAVFNDRVDIVYSAGDGCTSSVNTSTVSGAGVLGPVSVACGGSSASGGFTESGSYSISTNSPYEVVMQTNLTLGTSNDGLAEGGGTVEGDVSLDPIFTVPTGYTLELSPGVGDTASSSPEPATWVMFAAGMGLLGVSWRRRGRSVE